jgi:hypothetical protein
MPVVENGIVLDLSDEVGQNRVPGGFGSFPRGWLRASCGFGRRCVLRLADLAGFSCRIGVYAFTLPKKNHDSLFRRVVDAVAFLGQWGGAQRALRLLGHGNFGLYQNVA